MKKNIAGSLLLLLLVIVGATSCRKMEVETPGFFTSANFPVSESQYIAATGPVYITFRGEIPLSYWFLQSFSTDEAILPAHNGSWYDGGRYMQLHMHTWTKDHPHVSGAWSGITSTISTCNQVLTTILAPAPESATKMQFTAEIKTMRALAYFMMMDLWGNIPVTTVFGDSALPVTTSRKEVFTFIESEVKAALPSLSTATGISTYGRPNKYTAYALLAKMYLNAAVYTGTERNNDAIAMCDSVINSAAYQLETDYRAMFGINNGPTAGGGKEFIMAVPYDNKNATGQYFARYYLHRSVSTQTKYSLPVKASGVVSTLPEYYANFSDPADQRNKIWLTGKQYDYSGNALTVATTKSGYDASYSGSDASASYVYQVDLTPNVTIRTPASFDAGNDELSWAQGYRCIKYYPDSTSGTRDQSNDVPVFRYADILLMKAEAIARGGTPTLSQTALSLVNMVRKARSATEFSGISLDVIYAERCREFAWESWHRNDMIRFGKYEGAWGIKTDTDDRKRLFPIPTTAIALNPKLTQNSGY